jgi:hypothetical protein
LKPVHSKKPLSLADLQQFTGSESFYRHGIVRRFLYTDGVQYVAEHAGAYWLIDEIALSQKFNKAVAAEEFQVWTLTVNSDNRTALLICDDGNRNVVLRKDIPFTDLPLPELKLFFTNDTLCLPTEY